MLTIDITTAYSVCNHTVKAQLCSTCVMFVIHNVMICIRPCK